MYIVFLVDKKQTSKIVLNLHKITLLFTFLYTMLILDYALQILHRNFRELQRHVVSLKLIVISFYMWRIMLMQVITENKQV